jgi:hypothetical protein
MPFMAHQFANRAKLKAVKPKRKNIKINFLQLSKNNQRFSEQKKLPPQKNSSLT